MDDQIVDAIKNRNLDKLDDLSKNIEFTNSLIDAIIKIKKDIDSLEFLLQYYGHFIDVNRKYKIQNDDMTIFEHFYYGSSEYDALKLFFYKYFGDIIFDNDNMILFNIDVEICDYIINHRIDIINNELITKIFNYTHNNDIQYYLLENFGCDIMKNMDLRKIFNNYGEIYDKYIKFDLFMIRDINEVFNYFLNRKYSCVETLEYFLELDSDLIYNIDIYKIMEQQIKIIEYIIQKYKHIFNDIDLDKLFQSACLTNLDKVILILQFFPEINVCDNKVAIMNACENKYIIRYLLDRYFF